MSSKSKILIVYAVVAFAVLSFLHIFDLDLVEVDEITESRPLTEIENTVDSISPSRDTGKEKIQSLKPVQEIDANVHSLPATPLEPKSVEPSLPQATKPEAPAYSIFPVLGTGREDIISDWDDPRGDQLHEAIDIQAPRGTPAVAVANGVVSRVAEHPQAGLYVVLHDTLRNLFLYYAHLDEQLVRKGQTIRIGETLGLVGDTGNAKGTVPHLHFAIRIEDGTKLDPMPFLVKDEEDEDEEEQSADVGR